MASTIDASDTTDWERHVTRLVALLLAGDATNADTEVRDAISGDSTPADAHVRLITPALHRIGELWQRGDINVAVEHRASEICVAIVARLSERFRGHGPTRGTAVTLTPPVEQHALASAMVADCLRAAGFAVHHLGAGVPAGDLSMFLSVVPVDLVCFSVTQPLSREQYGELGRACREPSGDATVIFGGQGLDAAAAAAVGAVALSGITELARYVDER